MAKTGTVRSGHQLVAKVKRLGLPYLYRACLASVAISNAEYRESLVVAKKAGIKVVTSSGCESMQPGFDSPSAIEMEGDL
jgi:hypothetical protein